MSFFLVGPLCLAVVSGRFAIVGWGLSHLFAAFCVFAAARLSMLGFWKKLSGNGLFCTAGILLLAVQVAAFALEDREARYRMLEAQLGMAMVFGLLLVYLVRVRARAARSKDANLRLQKSVGKDFEHQKLENALAELKALQAQLVHQEKLASLGQLTAGVAHEINNPINFVSSNVQPLKRDLEEISQILQAIDKLDPDDLSLPDAVRTLLELRTRLDAPYLLQEVRQLLDGIQEGAARTIEIVKGLSTFSRADEDARKPIDVHEALDSTLLLLRNQCKDRVEVVRDYQAEPTLEGYPGQLNQVFMNLLSNAVQAIPGQGTVTLSTRPDGDRLQIRIRDTGTGIDPAHHSRLFEPFFTTKQVGEGTGLGLSICYGIVKRHSGTIDFDTEPGTGTEFILTLPRMLDSSLPDGPA